MTVPHASSRPSFLALALAVLVLALYGQAVGYRFINLDDEVYVTQNPHVLSGLSRADLEWAWTTHEASNWHPLTWWSLQLDAELFGARPSGYHLTNVLLHTANTLLLFWVWCRLTGAAWRSALVAALFAVHPLHVESVAWVAERKDVLSTFFFLLALGAYVSYARQPAAGRYLRILLLFGLGLLAKSMLVTFPCVLLLLDWWPLERLRRNVKSANLQAGKKAVVPQQGNRGRLATEKLPLFVLAAVSALLTFEAQRGRAVLTLSQAPLQARLANALISYVTYLRQVFWPMDLIVFYPYPSGEELGRQAAIAGLVPALISAAVVKLRHRCPYLVVGWLWYVGTLVPVIGLVQVGSQAMADRYTYIPSIGLFLALVWLGADLAERWHVPAFIRSAVAVLVIGACFICCWVQLGYWQDSVTLWEHALQVEPENYYAHYNLGLLSRRAGEIDSAIEHYQHSLEADPNFPDAHNDLAIALLLRDKAGPAIEEFQKTLTLEPGRANTWDNLGHAHLMENELERALACYRKAIELQPSHALYHADLAHALWKRGKPAAARSEYQQANELDPAWTKPLQRSAWVLATHPQERLRQPVLAVRLAEEICEATEYEDWRYLDTLGATLAAAGRYEEAQRVALQALALGPPERDASAIRERLRSYEKPQQFQQGIQSRPNR